MTGNHTPLVSIVTPTRDYGRYLPAALVSVQAQHDDHVEHIVVDGASMDNTPELLASWSGRRFRWVSEPDGGQSDALNKGRQMADGEWLGWLNADEFYLPWTFDHWRATLRAHPDADVIFGDMVWVDAQSRVMRLLPQHGFGLRLMRWYGCYVASCTVLVRASALPERFLDTSLRRWMDWDLWMTMAEAGAKFVHVGSPLAAFAVHPEAVTFAYASLKHPEMTRIRAQHGIPTRAVVPHALRAAARLEHVARKTFNGGYRKQMRVSRLGGRPLDWWSGSEPRSVAEQLHDSCCDLCAHGTARP